MCSTTSTSTTGSSPDSEAVNKAGMWRSRRMAAVWLQRITSNKTAHHAPLTCASRTRLCSSRMLVRAAVRSSLRRCSW